jgi:uncharacterized protein (TIGR02118 family)
MAVKLVVLYATPPDQAGFDRHYSDVHAPLARQLPGLQHFESSHFGTALDGGDLPFHLMAELTFANQGALESAFASEPGQAAGADYQQIAAPGSRMFVVQVD